MRFIILELDPPPCPSLYGGEYILLGGRDFVKGLIGLGFRV
jgi:hypothetical protein